MYVKNTGIFIDLLDGSLLFFMLIFCQKKRKKKASIKGTGIMLLSFLKSVIIQEAVTAVLLQKNQSIMMQI